MIIILKENANTRQVENLTNWLKQRGFDLHMSVGSTQSLIGLIGDTSKLDIDLLTSLDVVDTVRRIQEPYKSANRKFHPADTVIDVAGKAKIGGGNFMMIAGPCSVETHDQIISVAQSVKASGAHVLRGGAFKPRTSPYSFQGLHGKGIDLLEEAREASGLPIITEIMDINHLPLFENVDIIQVGARNMQNFELLKELGQTKKPILLKRGLANTIEELLMSAEYIMAGGNENVSLCERAIRTVETAPRNTLDLSAIPVLHKHTHLPVVIDPSHATGINELVAPMALAAVAAGADGLIIEVHNDPPHALCDGKQSLTPEQFDDLAKKIRAILPYGFRKEEWA
ncbi:MAG: 3-deoxy-7-phosphoheptulonate synthase [Clostridia bacterium]|nr:3-deoxy-7-phosphoheptulonate synthase [Clostridia bacterium]